MDKEGDLQGTTATVVQYAGGEEFGDAFVVYPSVKVLANANFEAYLKPRSSSSSVLTASSLMFLMTLCTLV